MKSLYKYLKPIVQSPQQAVGASRWHPTICLSKPLALKLLAFLPALLTLNPTPVGAVLGGGTFGPRYSNDLRGDIVLIGNTLTACTTTNTTCSSILNGTTLGHNQTTGLTLTRVDADGASATTTNSSRASLKLPAGSTVVKAYLYYQSAVASTTQPTQDTQVRFARTTSGTLPTDANYANVTATAIENFSTTATAGYTAFADVTSIVQTGGSGDYWVGDLNGSTTLGSWSGWSMVIVFSNPSSQIRNLSVNDGSAIVGILTSIPSQDVTISGFKTPNSGIFDAKIGAVAYDGDRSQLDNGYLVNGTAITDTQNSATDAFNSSITDMGTFYSPTWGRNPNYNNTLSVDVDLLAVPTPTVIPNGATTAKFTVASSNETLYLQALTTSIEVAAISGTLYRDNNSDKTFNSGESTLPAGISINLLKASDNSVVATTTTIADGSYTFARDLNGNYITDGSYKIQVDTNDTDIPAGLVLNTPNNIAITLAGSPIKEQNFGFLTAISGTIFEDVNYGGGIGRSLATSSGVGRPSARVELYNSSGSFVASTTTDTNGTYTFSGVTAGTYTVRIVNSTVTSSRGGTGLIGVQTFRTSGLTGTVGTADPNRVGGEIPTEVDAPANTTSQTLTTINAVAGQEAQSVTSVTVGSSSISGIDFGFNFDTIVNTKDAGQGSLRQFILNSNALPNTGLAQAGLTAGVETSIFMISDGAARSGLRAGLTNQFSNGAATITLATALPTITDANTAIDGRRQTAITGDTNAAVSESTTGPEIIIDVAAGPGLQTTAANTLFDSLGITGANGTGTVGAGVYFNGAAVAGSIIRNSTVFSNDNAGITLQSSATNVQVLNNITRNNGVAEPNADGIEFVGVNNITVSGNQSLNNAGYGLDMLTSPSTNNTITNNVFKGNGFSTGTQDAGIGVRQGSNNIVSLNTITGNQGDGIVIPLLAGGNTGNTITRNSIFANGELGIDLGSTTNAQGDGVTLNDSGDIDAGGNGLLNFPVIQNATVSGSNLILSGFARPGSIIELFIADPDSSGFGEGRTYLVTLTEGSSADADSGTGLYVGLLNNLNQGTDTTNRFRFTIPLPTGVSSGTQLTATATVANATSEFSGVATVAGSPNLVLVKRITAINSTPITTVVDDPNDPNDTNSNWPSGALQGAIAGSVQPQQEIEYTIYFLSTGSSDAVDSRLCDLVPTNTTFVADAYSSGRGIRRTLGSTPTDFTNINDADQGRFYTSTETAPTVCQVGSSVNGTVLNNVNGAVVVDLGTIPRAISAGNPANSYGFVRFRVKVN